MELEVCILAGGLSSRMGRDKSRMRLGKRTLVGHLRTAAAEWGYPVRVIRKDLVPRCGPLGGVYTALKTTKAKTGRVLFLSCDMPFVQESLIRRLVRASEAGRAAFVRQGGRWGFPFVMGVEALAVLEAQLERGEYSLQTLACALQAVAVPPSMEESASLFNINTPEDWREARRWYLNLSSGGARHSGCRRGG